MNENALHSYIRYLLHRLIEEHFEGIQANLARAIELDRVATISEAVTTGKLNSKIMSAMTSHLPTDQYRDLLSAFISQEAFNGEFPFNVEIESVSHEAVKAENDALYDSMPEEEQRLFAPLFRDILRIWHHIRNNRHNTT